MAYPEPSNKDLQRIADADAEAAHDAKLAEEVFQAVGEPKTEEEREWAEQIVFKTLALARAWDQRADGGEMSDDERNLVRRLDYLCKRFNTITQQDMIRKRGIAEAVVFRLRDFRYRWW